MLGVPIIAPLPMYTMLPEPWGIITFAAACVQLKTPLRLVAMTSSHSRSSISQMYFVTVMPALQTIPSRWPNESMAAATMRRPPSIVEASSATATASPPAAVISSTTALAGPIEAPSRLSTSPP